ncbi:anthrone oxygenase family protein [Dactylosporangium sp. CA-092794]|uniref:anthrone oxygenase family protein n=1 Tax=Dactylosporangium sp. CA-092794 TaxID=3239929 RepID=UPI003D8D1FD4
MTAVILQAIGLCLAGILAGEEFIVRYGIQPALRGLDDHAHVAARVALVRTLRIVVPIVMLPTVALGVAVLIVSGSGTGAGFRWAGMAALAAFMLFSLLGTVPINIKVIEWRADNPPPDWRATVLRWQRIDTLRSSAAILAFGCFVIALATRIP